MPEIPIEAGANNLNGIAATRNGRYLLAVQSNTGDLWRIATDASADVQKVDLGGAALTNGDGLLLRGRRLFVVQNRDNRIAVVRLADRFTTGSVRQAIVSEDFDVPTTLARSGGKLFAVNARFGTPDPPSADFWVTKLR